MKIDSWDLVTKYVSLILWFWENYLVAAFTFLLGISVNHLVGWSWTYSGNWGRQCWNGAHLMPIPWQGEKGSTAGRVSLILPRKESSWVYCNSSTSHRYRALSHRPCLKQPLGFQGGKEQLVSGWEKDVLHILLSPCVLGVLIRSTAMDILQPLQVWSLCSFVFQLFIILSI